LVKQGKLDDAISHYSQALQRNSELAYVHNNLGVALVKQGRMTDAIRHFSQALRINPEYAGAHNNIRYVRSKQGRMGETNNDNDSGPVGESIKDE